MSDDIDKMKQITEMIPSGEEYLISLDGYTFRLHSIRTYSDYKNRLHKYGISEDTSITDELDHVTNNFIQWATAIKEERIPPYGGLVTEVKDNESLIRMNVDDFSLDNLIMRIKIHQL